MDGWGCHYWGLVGISLDKLESDMLVPRVSSKDAVGC